MRVAILGLGTIGTTYAYAFQKAGHETFHIIRENKQNAIPTHIPVHILDGRHSAKGEEYDDVYNIIARTNDEQYDFILISVASGKLADAIKTVKNNRIKGTIIIFCNLWDERRAVERIIGNIPYIAAFPTAGGQMRDGLLNCVLFDHIMLESEPKCNIPNYQELLALLNSAGIKQEMPHDMFEWIYIHMAINAAVSSTAARNGGIDNPNRLAHKLMGSSKELALAVRCIRETVKTVAARGVDLKLYRNELLPYKIPARIAGLVMKRMFRRNELVSRIMTLHNDVDDIVYGCRCIYDEAIKRNLDLPLFYGNMNKILSTLQGQ